MSPSRQAREVTTTRRIDRVEGPFSLDLVLPGSKSIALRHILMSTLAVEATRLEGVPRCDDIDAMLDCVARLGTSVGRDGKTATLHPAGGSCGPVQLDLGMSGVSLRLLLAHAALRTTRTTFTGHAQLHHRPNRDLLESLEEIGCTVESAEGFLPVSITGPAVPEAHATLRTDVTSQYLTALLLSAAGLPRGLRIRLRGERASASYIGVTETEMARRGALVRWIDDATVFVPPGRYRGGRVVIEGDASAATYHMALATLHRGTVSFSNLGNDTRQGEFAFADVCERAGARIERAPESVRVSGTGHLESLGTVDFSNMPDAAPTAMAMAPFLPNPTRLTGLATLRVKECDRIAAGTAELRKVGVRVDEFDDAMTIYPAANPHPADLETYEDHRMAMALSVLASRIGDCRIQGADCVTKTYADYWDDFGRVY